MIRSMILACLALVFAVTAPCAAANKELMSVKMAKQDLTRNLVESVVGFKVKSESQMGLTEDPRYEVQSKAAAVIKGVIVDKMIYDREKDIALAFGHIDLGTITNVLGEVVQFKNVTVRSIGFGSMTQSSRPPLMALRAALLNAYDQMAELLVGEKILSKSRTENFVLTEDINHAKVCAAVFGAYIPNIDLNSPNRGWGWDESGNAFVRLQLDVRTVKDILGNRLRYSDGEHIVEVLGQGSQTDELNPDAASMIQPAKAKPQYQSLDVPGAGGAPGTAGQ
ncbi:MAG: hypothetical protein LDL30_05735 [Desulfovibrio sp.]|nr:hypothetical protein [Desulfovibrio sp.]MCA1985237.1 hypothetical protein [Desulfovibrio sp.]